jgi:hypothetical protein
MGLVSFRNPSSGGFRALLPGGEEVVVESNPPRDATGVYAIPARGDLERLLVPHADLEDPAYAGYALVITFDQLAKHFELVADA